jgi:hypothetical protein
MEQSCSQATLITVLKKVLARIPINLTEKKKRLQCFTEPEVSWPLRNLRSLATT